MTKIQYNPDIWDFFEENEELVNQYDFKGLLKACEDDLGSDWVDVVDALVRSDPDCFIKTFLAGNLNNNGLEVTYASEELLNDLNMHYEPYAKAWFNWNTDEMDKLVKTEFTPNLEKTLTNENILYYILDILKPNYAKRCGWSLSDRLEKDVESVFESKLGLTLDAIDKGSITHESLNDIYAKGSCEEICPILVNVFRECWWDSTKAYLNDFVQSEYNYILGEVFGSEYSITENGNNLSYTYPIESFKDQVESGTFYKHLENFYNENRYGDVYFLDDLYKGELLEKFIACSFEDLTQDTTWYDIDLDTEVPTDFSFSWFNDALRKQFKSKGWL